MSSYRESTAPEQVAALKALAETCTELAEVQTRADALFSARIERIERCLALNVTHREIAEAAGVSKEAIAKALRKARATT